MVQIIQLEAGVKKVEAIAIVETLLATIKKCLLHKEKVEIAEFGSFVIKRRTLIHSKYDKNPYDTVIFKPATLFEKTIQEAWDGYTIKDGKKKIESPTYKNKTATYDDLESF